MGTKSKINQLVAYLKDYQPQKIYLFGSYARGSHGQDSDMDILVVKETKQPFPKRIASAYKSIWPVQRQLGPVDIVVYTPSEMDELQSKHDPFITEITQTGSVIYEQ